MFRSSLRLGVDIFESQLSMLITDHFKNMLSEFFIKKKKKLTGCSVEALLNSANEKQLNITMM